MRSRLVGVVTASPCVDDFLAAIDDFVIDEDTHKFLLTFNPRGYLRRIS